MQCLRDCGRPELADYLSGDGHQPEPCTALECVQPHSSSIIKKLKARPSLRRSLQQHGILDEEDIEHIKKVSSIDHPEERSNR